jgi:hypothetical protein
LPSTRTNAQGLACHVADDLIERIAAGVCCWIAGACSERA